MKNYCSFLLLFLTISLFAQVEDPTRIYLVRHAEKMTNDPKEKDPLLTEYGNKRAIALAKKLKYKTINNIYSTNYKRTQSTVIPSAKQQKKDIQLYDAKILTVEAAKILKENKGKTALIVGHSNTVLETIEAFGSKRPIPSIDDQEFNYLFLLTIQPNGKTKVKVMHYGQANSYKEGAQMMH
ncbi:histidine phosphatase family protein [Flavobacterium sp. XN-5]|uniref:phosphoglycerate mutase family protein n=1 Tax=Flavobacterium sp. XN-5 TaxID=2599390 RepID=UPI0011C8ED87|nr:phosphoglycerate mutase family protein [Flavobacterium sp. XN-5]NGY38187.1 histidine phosphatase family protein [Flavobacterium sp. XN-5]